MNLKQIEAEALKLTETERAELAHSLLLSLGEPSGGAFEAAWLEEARRRADELDSGSAKPVPAEEVSTKARQLLI